MTTTASRSTLRGGLLLLASAFVLMAGPAEARQRIQFLNDGRGTRDLPDTRGPETVGPMRSVLVQGPLAHDRSTGLRIANLALRITSSTVIDTGPSGSSYSSEPARLAGRRATVFGRSRGKVLDARMVILEAEDLGLRNPARKKSPSVQWAEMSETGEATGRLLSDAPN